MRTIFSKLLLAVVAGSLCFATAVNAQSWQRQQDFNRQRQIDQQRQDAMREQMRRAEQQRVRDSIRQAERDRVRSDARAQVLNNTRDTIKQDRVNEIKGQATKTASQQREEWRRDGRLGVARPAGDGAGRAGPFRASNGIAQAPRQPTPAEAKRGYTGKVTADGKALVRFQGRVVTVPASRIGVMPRPTATSQAALATGWSQQTQASISADIKKLLGGGVGNSGVTQTFNTAATAISSGRHGILAPDANSRIILAIVSKNTIGLRGIRIDANRIKHILDGDGPGRPGGGHRFGTGKPNKSEFPRDWGDRKIIESVLHVAEKGAIGDRQSNGNYPHRGTVDGVDIEVIVEPKSKSVVTAYPTNTPMNPRKS